MRLARRSPTGSGNYPHLVPPLFEPVFDPEAQTRREPQSRRPEYQGREEKMGVIMGQLGHVVRSANVEGGASGG